MKTKRFYYFNIARWSCLSLFGLLAIFMLPLVFCELAVGAQARPSGRLPVSPPITSKLTRDGTVGLIIKLNVSDAQPVHINVLLVELRPSFLRR